MPGLGEDDFFRKMWERFAVKRAWFKRILEEAVKDIQSRADGSWQEESLHKEELDIL